jgi:hypothetical protein
MSSRPTRDSKDPDTSPETPRDASVARDDTELPASPIPEDHAPTDPPGPNDAVARSGERASRRTRRERRVANEDTLLSLPAPAPSFEIEIEDRLDDMERGIESLTDRIRALESRPVEPPPRPLEEPRPPDQRWLIWVVFLLALALIWQVVTKAR